MLLGICASGSVFAHSAPVPFVGIMGGVAHPPENRDAFSSAGGRFRPGDREANWVGGFVAGYDRICASWIWGMEAEIARQWQVNRCSHTAYADRWSGRRATFGYRRQNVFALSGRLGCAVAPLLLYTRVGISMEPHQDQLIYVDSSRKHAKGAKYWEVRFFAGAGIEAPLPLSFGGRFRIEYHYYTHPLSSVRNQCNPLARVLKGGVVWYFG